MFDGKVWSQDHQKQLGPRSHSLNEYYTHEQIEFEEIVKVGD